MRVLVEVIDPAGVETACAPLYPMHLIALIQQQLSQVTAILACYACYESFFAFDINSARCQRERLEVAEGSGNAPWALNTKRIVLKRIKRSNKKEKFFK